MRKKLLILALWMFCVPGVLLAVVGDELMVQGKVAFDRAVEVQDPEVMKEAVKLFEQAMQADAASYDALWWNSRAHGSVGEYAKRNGTADYKETCRTYGKAGIELARKAQELDPSRPEAFFYEAWNVGIYSDGVSIITAIKEDLKNSAENGFHKAYDIDKRWNHGASIVALGHFYGVLPWPMRDKKRSLGYFEECEREGFLTPANPQYEMAMHYYTEQLMVMKKYDRARPMLEKLAKSEKKLFREEAEKYLKKIN